ncbi:MAG: T9SS type A sorting domain-containing protein [Bacteroidota bacterium]
MKTILLRQLIIFSLINTAAFSQTHYCSTGAYYNSEYINNEPVNNPPEKIGWHFIHQEEFDGATDIDSYFWHKWDINWNNEMFFLPSNIVVNNGRCNLNVNYSPGNYTDWAGTHFYNYTSAYMHTKDEYGPGYFWEMKGKRNDIGFKSSFWSYNYNNDEDPDTLHHKAEGISVFDNGFGSAIDLNENFSEIFGPYNKLTGYGCKAIFRFNQNPGPWPPPLQCCMPLANATDHTYSLDYQSNEVKIYVNNKLMVKTTNDIPQSTQSMGFWATNNYWDATVYPYNNKMEMDYIRLYKKNEETTYQYNNFCKNQGYINQNIRPRFIADFNNDGKKDIIAFGYQNVNVSMGNIANRNISILPFNSAILNEYTVEQGWTNQDTRPRLIGDINGDMKADVVGFGLSNSIASLSNSSTSISFLPVQYLGNIYTSSGGWQNQNTNQRFLADVNGDLKDDIVGFGSGNVHVSLSNSTSSTASFYPQAISINNFTTGQGWTNQNVRPRFLSDVNGDGKKDIVGFGYNSVYVSLSNCTANTVSFTAPVALYNDFTVEQGYTDQNIRPRYLADINGDGKDDIIAIGYNNVYASLSNCSGNNVNFSPPTSTILYFTGLHGYLNSNDHPRYLCDINNDKKADIIGFNDNMIQIALSTSTGSTPSFSQYNNFIDDFTSVKGWSNNNNNPRQFSDLNGDGSLDLVGFGDEYITSYQSVGGTYNIPFTVFGNNKTTSNDWVLKGTPTGKDAHYKFYLRYPTDISVTSCFPETNFWEILSIRGIDGSNKANLNVGQFNTNCQMITSLDPGYYYVVVDGNNGDIGDFKIQVTGVEHPQRIGHFGNNKEEEVILEHKVDFTIYPNPSNGTFEILAPEKLQNANVEVLDIFGKVLNTTKILSKETKILNDLESGVYFVKVTDTNGISNVKKIVIER